MGVCLSTGSLLRLVRVGEVHSTMSVLLGVRLDSKTKSKLGVVALPLAHSLDHCRPTFSANHPSNLIRPFSALSNLLPAKTRPGAAIMDPGGHHGHASTAARRGGTASSWSPYPPRRYSNNKTVCAVSFSSRQKWKAARDGAVEPPCSPFLAGMVVCCPFSSCKAKPPRKVPPWLVTR